ncbi:MAG TPA: SCO family protein [Verrucomicrobiae bacterium]|nr:SCO family protein [Verrucomicrobiae bacterium]
MMKARRVMEKRLRLLGICAVLSGLFIPLEMESAEMSKSLTAGAAPVQIFPAKGVVLEVKPDSRTVVIRHEAISNYMAAMTMPFKVPGLSAHAGLQRGDEISFQFHVTAMTSWVDRIVKTGTVPLPKPAKPADSERAAAVNTASANPLLFYVFTNELGQPVKLDDFHGQALGVTFFYTRCPVPNYCPRLSKNFQEASQKLEAMPHAPTNWHFLSITFDPANDTPAMLKAYGESHHYDPEHWSFLTGPPDKIAELARACGVEYEPNAGAINHNFRTLIVNAAGHLQTVFPTSGDLSDDIADQILQAAVVTNRIGSPVSK